MATAVETFTWVVYETLLKAYLGIVGTGEDAQLQPWLEAAAKDCDRFCGWKYTDFDGEEVDETPDDPSADPEITLGIYEWVRVMRATWTARPLGLKAGRVGAHSETYASGSAGIVPLKIARAHAEEHWAESNYNPLIAGKGYSA